MYIFLNLFQLLGGSQEFWEWLNLFPSIYIFKMFIFKPERREVIFHPLVQSSSGCWARLKRGTWNSMCVARAQRFRPSLVAFPGTSGRQLNQNWPSNMRCQQHRQCLNLLCQNTRSLSIYFFFNAIKFFSSVFPFKTACCKNTALQLILYPEAFFKIISSTNIFVDFRSFLRLRSCQL